MKNEVKHTIDNINLSEFEAALEKTNEAITAFGESLAKVTAPIVMSIPHLYGTLPFDDSIDLYNTELQQKIYEAFGLPSHYFDNLIFPETLDSWLYDGDLPVRFRYQEMVLRSLIRLTTYKNIGRAIYKIPLKLVRDVWGILSDTQKIKQGKNNE